MTIFINHHNLNIERCSIQNLNLNLWPPLWMVIIIGVSIYNDIGFFFLFFSSIYCKEISVFSCFSSKLSVSLCISEVTIDHNLKVCYFCNRKLNNFFLLLKMPQDFRERNVELYIWNEFCTQARKKLHARLSIKSKNLRKWHTCDSSHLEFSLKNYQLLVMLKAGVQKMSERANEVRGKFWPIGGNFYQQFKN